MIVKTNKIHPVPKPAPREKRAELSIFYLYVFFFFMWLVGYLIGLYDSSLNILGMPLWFILSCLLSFVIIVFTLVFTIKRCF